jgi:hypothetical protein
MTPFQEVRKDVLGLKTPRHLIFALIQCVNRVLIASFLLCISTIPVTSRNSSVSIYYQSGEFLYRITEDQVTEVVATDMSETLIFSNSGPYAAFRDHEGLWLGQVDDWNPTLVVAGDLGGLYWTPDDTRIILRIAGIPTDISSGTESLLDRSLAYNLMTEEVETWPWGNCSHLVRRININEFSRTSKFALICSVYPGIEDFEPQSIALQWGGEYQAFNAGNYEFLVSYPLNPYPPPFNWFGDGEKDNLIFIAANPNYQRSDSNFSLWEIYYVDGNNPVIALGSKRDPSVVRLIATSPDQEKVAYGVRCYDSDSRVCLQIADLSSREIIWNYEDTMSLVNFYDIAWYPDNERVAILGTNTVTGEGHTLAVFTLSSGDLQIYELNGETTGRIIIR